MQAVEHISKWVHQDDNFCWVFTLRYSLLRNNSSLVNEEEASDYLLDGLGDCCKASTLDCCAGKCAGDLTPNCTK